MNIKEAKQEIINTVRAYTQRDETGAYEIPTERQRPILLIGPPGIGKTAIMEQVAQECGINLVAYTITHHTRQSAIGLPFITDKSYGGRPYKVTEYTMSEIIASVYDQIEQSGVQEGILFLDEINCVSETLAPTMLQFLQYKTFGTHHLPEGFLIVTAGNPPQYNKSVRDFDIATLDRVRKINVEEDFDAWKEYAYKAGVHGSVIAYLDIRRENFYRIRTDIEDRYFVTARGWEDLSRILHVYEKTGLPVSKNLIVQYLQDPEIAGDFADYYELYNKYRNVYRIPDILNGDYPDNAEKIKNSPFDEKLSLISLLIDSLNTDFRRCAEELAVQKLLVGKLQGLAGALKSGADAPSYLQGAVADEKAQIERGSRTKMLERGKIRTMKLMIAALEEMENALTLDRAGRAEDPRADFRLVKALFDKREKQRQEEITKAGDRLTHSFEFMSRTFGEGQEMVIFLSELSAGYYSLQFVSENGNEAYYKYNKLLLPGNQEEALRQEALQLSG